MKKIIYVSPSTVPSRAANSVHVALQANALKSNYGSITLFCKKSSWMVNLKQSLLNTYGTEFEHHEIDAIYYPFDRASTLVIALYASIKLFFRKKQSSILSRNLYFNFIWTVLMRRSAVYETHQVENRFAAIIQKAVLKNTKTYTVVISDKLKEILSETYSIKLLKCSVLHDAANDIDVSSINNESSSASLFNDMKNDETFSEIVGYFGHLYPGRGIEIIIGLAAENIEMLFVICGGNPEQVKQLKNQDLPKNIKILGYQSHLNARRLMAECSILLMPYQNSVSIGPKSSDTSSFMSPMKMFEYMSLGKPIISSNLEVLREVLTDKNNAILVEPTELQQWQKALNSIKNCSELAIKIGSNARSQFLARHTWAARAKEISYLLDNLN